MIDAARLHGKSSNVLHVTGVKFMENNLKFQLST